MREALVFFVATSILVGAPALHIFEELRDPSCARQEAESEKPFRALAVEEHRIAKCLGEGHAITSEERLAAASGESRALFDPTW